MFPKGSRRKAINPVGNKFLDDNEVKFRSGGREKKKKMKKIKRSDAGLTNPNDENRKVSG